ncbi:SRPBCC domain-containing protein [Pseudoflavitalea sp. G-6-1-2]|uniref:SRPBCC family protein n=1 Tax=Pseudoflavitalea sp. G-6-1-2 TaxID=2728841 RepID=UPI00146B1940|nr:SRPBCC domain-containing protein [Pseudoflavitalea sp. G-6-1-2]NML19528.1 SRPBCC domain-containing protein [Pseudoflavitalea sp. G-6-1-2]
MADIRHKLTIKAAPAEVYHAITTQEGLSHWWCRNTVAKTETGFVNRFSFGKFVIEMKIMQLAPTQKVVWECLAATEEWIGTKVTFDLEDKDGNTVLRFGHTGWETQTDLFAVCSFDWAMFLRSLKLLCETGEGEPQ